MKIETLGVSGNTISFATGFLIQENDFLSLYTCWHVFCGFDPRNVPSNYPEKRCRIRISSIAAEQRTPAVQVIGGTRSNELPLFDALDQPLWIQSGPIGEVTESIGIPSFDCVRLVATDIADKLEFNFSRNDDLPRNWSQPGQDVFIVGYPYGYSASEISPEPIFIKRSVASRTLTEGANSILDGGGAKCMSGSPVCILHNGEWRIIGMYVGIVYPEATHFADTIEGERGSGLPLGKFISLGFVRGILGADPHE